MKRAIVFLAAGGILTTLTFCLAAAPDPNAESSEMEQLRKEVVSLRERVESLEKRLNERSIVIPRGRGVPPLNIEPNSLPGLRSTPRDWRRFEFNGAPYYIVPINAGRVPGPGK